MTVPPSAPGRHMLHGSAWMIGLRWSLRLCGVASTIILARLLSPRDFGIIAIAMLFVGLLETLGETGERLALIRLPELDRGHYDTAFCLQLIVGLVLGIVIFALAPLSQRYFHEPQAVGVIRLLSLRAILGGLENIGTVDFRRDFRFGAAYRLSLLAKLGSAIATVVLAALTRSYWALAAGILISQAAMTVLSYVMHPYRPRLSLARWRDLYGFSGWTLLRALGLYLTSQVDRFAVGGFAGAGMLGRYTVAMDLAASPTSEIHEPIIGVLYPVLSRCRHDPVAVRVLFMRVFGWSALICAATAAGLVAIARDYSLLMLGSGWGGVETLIPFLAAAASITCIGASADPLFDMLGQPQKSARLQWLRLLLLAIAVLVATLWRDLLAIAVARLVAVAICLPLTLLPAAKAAGIPPAHYLGLVWRPLSAAMVMSLVVIRTVSLLPASAIWHLGVAIPLGIVVYCGAILLVWRIAGQPEGPEHDIIAAANKVLVWTRTRLAGVNHL